MPKSLHFSSESCSFASRWELCSAFLLAQAPTRALSRTQRPSSAPALLGTFFSYVRKGLRVVNFGVCMCATKRELREIKPSLSKQKRCRATKVGLERLVCIGKHAWQSFSSKKANPARCLRQYFPIHHLLKALELTKNETL